MMENLETEALGILTLMDVDSFISARWILDLHVPEQKKGKCKLFKTYFKEAQFGRCNAVMFEVLLGTQNYMITKFF